MPGSERAGAGARRPPDRTVGAASARRGVLEAQFADLGDLVGGEYHQRLGAGLCDLFARRHLPCCIAADRSVLGDGEDKRGDFHPEPGPQFGRVSVGLLDDVVQSARGDHVIGRVSVEEKARDLAGMDDERCAVDRAALPPVPLFGIRERCPRPRKPKQTVAHAGFADHERTPRPFSRLASSRRGRSASRGGWRPRGGRG